MYPPEIRSLARQMLEWLDSSGGGTAIALGPLGSGKSTLLGVVGSELNARGQAHRVFAVDSDHLPVNGSEPLLVDDVHTLSPRRDEGAELRCAAILIATGASLGAAEFGAEPSRVWTLDAIARAEAARLLESAGWSETEHGRARGSPMVARWLLRHFVQPVPPPEVVRDWVDLMLVERYCADWMDRGERAALCALCAAGSLTIETLEAVLEEPEAARFLWQRLRSAVFVENTPRGLKCAPLLRDALLRHLGRTSPLLYQRVRERLEHVMTRCLLVGPVALSSVSDWLALRTNRHMDSSAVEDEPRVQHCTDGDSLHRLGWPSFSSSLAADVERCARSGFVRVGLTRNGEARSLIGGVWIDPESPPPDWESDIALEWLRSKQKSTLGGVELLLTPLLEVRPGLLLEDQDLDFFLSVVLVELLSRSRPGPSVHWVADPERFIARWDRLEVVAHCRGHIERDGELRHVVWIDWRRKPLQDQLQRSVRGFDQRGHQRETFAELLEGQMERAAQRNGLTPREVEVLNLLVLGRSSEEIGVALGISARTAKFHQANVLQKLGADTRNELLRILM